jgi:GNAT superfamily N-acetyltransferase
VSVEVRPLTPERFAVWSIVCFVVDKPLRARGIASALLAGAVEYAFAHGATSVEAYPHVTDERDYMGHTELYARPATPR